MPALLVANNLVLAAGLALLWLGRGSGAGVPGAPAVEERVEGERPEGDEKTRGPGRTFRLPDFIVHLRDAPADPAAARGGADAHFVRVAFELELPDEASRLAMTQRAPQIRDAFLAYLSDRTVGELRAERAIDRVKRGLAPKLAEIAPGVPVTGLYVVEFIVQ